MRKYIGDKRFYGRVLSLMIPIMVQTGITNFVNMLDNIMVGRIGTTEMTGVAVANQLIFVFNLCIFGALAGAGIFGAQFYGKGDMENLRYSFRFKFLFSIFMGAVGVTVFLVFGKSLSSLYLKGDGNTADAAACLKSATDYIKVMVIGLIPYSVVQCYSSTLRETDKPVVPMVAGLIAVCVNLVFNYFLIFGKFGFPKLGVIGAALATVLSRFVELGILIVWTYKNRHKCKFIIGAFKSMYIPISLVKSISTKGLPLMANETLWSAGIALVNQCYSVKGLYVVAANNICHTFFEVFGVAFMSVGSAAGIIVGQQLGAGNHDEAKDSARKLIVFSVFVCTLVSAVYALLSPYIPLIYNTTDAVREMAFRFMLIEAVLMPLDAFSHCAYFILRSGGKVALTMLFDCGYIWIIMLPMAFILANFTPISVYWVFGLCHGGSIIKDVLGYIFLKKGIWIKTLKS